jgi:hypothetical protein
VMGHASAPPDNNIGSERMGRLTGEHFL